MAECKFVILLISLQCALVVGIRGGSHSIIKGQRSTNPQDSELYSQNIEKSRYQPFMNGGVHGKYCYPWTATINDGPKIVITKFEVVDMDRDGIGNIGAVVKSGGVGKNQVCIAIISRPEASYKYEFKVYGYQRNPRNPVRNLT